MKVNVIGSHLCPDTLYALMQLKNKGASVEFANFAVSFEALRLFLDNREHNPMYEAVKANGGFGFPLFTLEDGSQTFDLDEVLQKL